MISRTVQSVGIELTRCFRRKICRNCNDFNLLQAISSKSMTVSNVIFTLPFVKFDFCASYGIAEKSGKSYLGTEFCQNSKPFKI